MPESYSVRVDKQAFVFSAAHFITYGDNVCERLHGHNYSVAVDIFGSLEQNQYVVDFIQVRDLVTQITAELDHRMLLPTGHPTIQVKHEGQEVIAQFESRRWVFPVDDCVQLPIANTTAELLARYIGQRLHTGLQAAGAEEPTRIRVSVDECQGQQGIWDWLPE